MIDCQIYYVAEYSFETRLPKRGSNTYDSGLKDSEKGEVKYGYPSSTQPILQIIAPIYDGKRNAIMPGFYELTLNDDNTFLHLCQRAQVIATIPVFKIEQDKVKMQKYAENNRKPKSSVEALKFKIRDKWQKRERQKKLNNKMIEENPEIYNDATIEYDIKGDYYIIKYERDSLRVWGVLKTGY